VPSEGAEVTTPLSADRRLGLVQALVAGPPPRVSLTLGGDEDAAHVVDAPYLDSYLPAVGDAVVVLSNQGSHFVLGRAALGTLAHVGFYSSALSAAVNSTSFTTVTGSTTASFTKVFDATRLECRLHVGCYVDVGGTQVEWAVRINATDHGPAAGQWITPSGEHQHMSGRTSADGVPAGTYTAVIRVRRTAGAGIINVNSGDPAWLTIDETWQ
jgi:hypothetical protein